MLSNDYTVYLENTMRLAKTIVIKSQDSIDLINRYIVLQYGNDAVDTTDPTSWKYYRNICGIYHPTDTVMTVVSLDTLETIVFDQSNLAIHTATRDAYAYGTRYYYTLLEQYPDQEQLILGILYPADMQTAIYADNGTILAYPADLVEPQEITLMDDLQSWIKRYIARWHVPAFGISDTLYPAAQHAIMYLNIVPYILNLRLHRCKTNEAHSFHIRQYLASHNGLDRYMDYMTLKQILFFYRNIAYIERNSGRTDIFEWLVDRLLTDRYIPIADYTARQRAIFDDQYYPGYLFRKRPINTQYNVPEKDYFTLQELQSKEDTLAPGNTDYNQQYYDRIDQTFKTVTSSVIQTKDLESSMIDYTDAVPHPLNEVLLNHWGYMSTHGLYDAVIRFSNPVTGDILTARADVAYIYMLYITSQAINQPLTVVPDYYVNRVCRYPRPTVEDLNSVVDRHYITDDTLAAELLAQMPRLKVCHSTSALFNLCHAIYTNSISQWYRISRTEHLYKRALVANMINRLYMDTSIQFADRGIPIDQWLFDNGLPAVDYTVDDCMKYISNIFHASTGYVVNPTTIVANIQKAMIAVLMQLSSYSIQVIQDINQSSIIPLNWAAIRFGDMFSSSRYEIFAPEGVDVYDAHVNVYHKLQFTVDLPHYKPGVSEYSASIYRDEIDLITAIDVSGSVSHYIDVPSPSFLVSYDEMNMQDYMLYGFVGIESYLALNDNQKSQIPDIYSNGLISVNSTMTDIADVIYVDDIDVISSTPLSPTKL